MTLLRIAWRNLWRNPRRTSIVVSAVSIGIGGVILTMAINYGMVVQMVDTAIRTELGHLQVHAPGYLDDPSLERTLPADGGAGARILSAHPAVASWAPRIRSEALIFSPRASAGVRLLGVDPGREADVSAVAGSLVAGRYLDGEARRLLIGEALARRLQVEVGDKVVVSVQDAAGDLTGEAFRIGGVFRTSSREFDRGTSFLHLREGQALLGLPDAISEIVALAEHRSAVSEIERALEDALGPEADVDTWEELQPLLVYTVEMFDQMGWYVYGAVFVAMAFGIANVLLMAVHERIRELGILAAIGMPPGRMVVMVVTESLVLVAVGLGLGLAAALLGVWLLRDGIDLSAFTEGLTAYNIGTRIVPVLRPADVWVPCLAALLTATLASLWPAVRAVRLRPAEAVRHV